MKSWPLYLRLQAGELRESPAYNTPNFARGSLLIGPSPEEEARLHQTVTGEITVLSLPLDMHEMPFDNGTFKAVYSSNVLEHSFAPYVALMECRRVLGSNGAAHFTMPRFAGPEGGEGPLHLHCLTADVWSELLHKTGFDVVEQAELDGHYEPRAGYHVFHCRAVQPPPPHDRMLATISRWVDDGRPPFNP